MRINMRRLCAVCVSLICARGCNFAKVTHFIVTPGTFAPFSWIPPALNGPSIGNQSYVDQSIHFSMNYCNNQVTYLCPVALLSGCLFPRYDAKPAWFVPYVSICLNMCFKKCVI
jgi:hypothetical protein